jgi:hypothetical protein
MKKFSFWNFSKNCWQETKNLDGVLEMVYSDSGFDPITSGELATKLYTEIQTYNPGVYEFRINQLNIKVKVVGNE